MTTKSALSSARRADVTGVGVPNAAISASKSGHRVDVGLEMRQSQGSSEHLKSLRRYPFKTDAALTVKSARKTGSPKPIKGFAPASMRAEKRKALRLGTEGRIVIACRFMR
jgi:hypothetical protein